MAQAATANTRQNEPKVIKSCTAIGKKEQLLCALSKGGEKRIFIG